MQRSVFSDDVLGLAIPLVPSCLWTIATTAALDIGPMRDGIEHWVSIGSIRKPSSPALAARRASCNPDPVTGSGGGFDTAATGRRLVSLDTLGLWKLPIIIPMLHHTISKAACVLFWGDDRVRGRWPFSSGTKELRRGVSVCQALLEISQVPLIRRLGPANDGLLLRAQTDEHIIPSSNLLCEKAPALPSPPSLFQTFPWATGILEKANDELTEIPHVQPVGETGEMRCHRHWAFP
ncbi:uncharacterized protein CLUP02_15209 [Colletotrichum lupini]|uniref:Uncharacterized protein n=1 Tax=Colletotrichum lupini TaxID=145971 RepID=A0A9Q8WN27_9PEZI|nr:uncharacterized protein CLUP02_15209 [Colletotrichum lupini]UQC89678.1 hypothetical protein CLUP02_15209 [Colletotrichum lupini]